MAEESKSTTLESKPEAQELKNPFQLAPHNKKMIFIAGLYIAVLGNIFQSTTLSTLLPVAAAEVGGMEYYSLASTLGGVVSVVVMPLWGYFGARNPAIKRSLFFWSLIIGAAVVLLRAFAPSMVFIVVTGLPWGVVSGGVFVLGYSMVRDMFDQEKTGSYLGFLGTMMALSGLFGPILGGLIMDFAGWRAVCFVIFPFLVVGAILVLMGPKATKEECETMAVKGGKFDVPGTVALVCLLVGMILCLSLGSSFARFGTLQSWALIVLAVVGLVWLIVVIKQKQADAIIPLPALKNRNTIAFAFSNLFANFSNMCIFFFMPMYVVNVMMLSATEASLSTAMMNILPLVLAPIFGKWIGKSGTAKGVLCINMIARIAVAVVLFFIMSPSISIFVVYVMIFLAGIYNGAQSVSFAAGPQIQLPNDIRVQANSVIQIGQNLGSALGISVYTLIIGMFGVVQGMGVALMVSAVGAALGLVSCLMLTKLNKE